ncbi:uncharacterized protein N7487_010158 [Penicillium crustosum]|uniref:uncharacterized protein n=1 Tax=Penicillium crustosum TaxID=36656 RepID=UPI00239346C6|nr:uncharacterized protein N7487_010158 [Penicillium crustosum]KAJ5395855.1 hypothetical protein N7487_010158 [Penicillium crustosum]
MGLIMTQSRILNLTDRDLFGRLVTYKRLEEPPHPTNIGPLVTCQECQYPRSHPQLQEANLNPAKDPQTQQNKRWQMFAMLLSLWTRWVFPGNVH